MTPSARPVSAAGRVADPARGDPRLPVPSGLPTGWLTTAVRAAVSGGDGRRCRTGIRRRSGRLGDAGVAGRGAARPDSRHLDNPARRAARPVGPGIGGALGTEYVAGCSTPSAFRRGPRTSGCKLAETADEPFCPGLNAAEAEAIAVLQRRQDLGWAFDVAGWAAERRGDRRVAVERYLGGLQTSWFSDDALRFRTHWFDEGYGKFAASRLAALHDALTPQQQQDPYLAIFLNNDRDTLRRRVQQYWITQAREAQRREAHRQAYRDYYRAGWDLGMLPISAYDEVFAQLRATALADGSPALAALAALHHQFLC